MILTGAEIAKKVKIGKILIDPFDEKQINPNSYNYRIGTDIFEVVSDPIDSHVKVKVKKRKIPKKGLVLLPKKLYLANTLEKIGSDDYVISLIGRSSIGRFGLFLQITSDLGHLGTNHCWTLELRAVQPLRIYPGMKIGQVSFWTTLGDKLLKYNGKYAKYSLPHHSEIYKEFPL